MDFEVFVQSLLSFVKSCDNLYYILYAVATCLLTQICKKIFVNKVKVDVLHKFDWAVILPFIFGLAFATVDLLFVRKMAFSVRFVATLVLSGASIGALATVIFKFLSSLSGQSLKSLQKNDIFGVFYTQLLYFGNVRKQLLDKSLSLKEFVAQVKLLATNAKNIYLTNETEDVKKVKLLRLLQGVVDSASIDACADVLHKALLAAMTQSTKK